MTTYNDDDNRMGSIFEKIKEEETLKKIFSSNQSSNLNREGPKSGLLIEKKLASEHVSKAHKACIEQKYLQSVKPTEYAYKESSELFD